MSFVPSLLWQFTQHVTHFERGLGSSETPVLCCSREKIAPWAHGCEKRPAVGRSRLPPSLRTCPWKASPAAGPNRSQSQRCHPVAYRSFCALFLEEPGQFSLPGKPRGEAAVVQLRRPRGWGRPGAGSGCGVLIKGTTCVPLASKRPPDWSTVIPQGRRILPVPHPSMCPVQP